MQQTGLDADQVHVHVGQDEGYVQGMEDVGFAGGAHLPFVALDGEPVSLLELREVLARAQDPEPGLDLTVQALDLCRR